MADQLRARNRRLPSGSSSSAHQRRPLPPSLACPARTHTPEAKMSTGMLASTWRLARQRVAGSSSPAVVVLPALVRQLGSSTASPSSPAPAPAPAYFRILALESSADDTAAACVDSDRKILSSVVVKQHDVHGRSPLASLPSCSTGRPRADRGARRRTGRGLQRSSEASSPSMPSTPTRATWSVRRLPRLRAPGEGKADPRPPAAAARPHAQPTAIRRALAEAQLGLDDVDAFAFTQGPGCARVLSLPSAACSARPAG